MLFGIFWNFFLFFFLKKNFNLWLVETANIDPMDQYPKILTWEGREVEAYIWTDLRIDRGRESYLLDSEFSLAQCLVQFVDLI